MDMPAARPVILQVLPALDAGGIEQGTIDMAQAITRAGGVALAACAGGRMLPRLGHAGGQHVPLDLRSKNPVSILLNARRLARVIRARGVHLVHARSRAPGWSAALACRLAGVPLVTTWHGVYRETVPGKRRYNAVMASGRRVIAISAFIARRLARDYRVGPDRLRVIPRGADTTRFDPAAVRGPRIQALAEQWGLPEGAAVIMLPGRLTRWKGQTLLLEALTRLGADGGCDRPFVCVFVGPGRRRDRFGDSLKQMVQARPALRGRVFFAGHCTDMPAALAMADVVVVPSLEPEPFGRVVVEAQAMGRPVVVAAHGAAMETVMDGETGLLVPPGDADALATAIGTMLRLTPEQAATLGAAARAHVLAHYTTEAMQHATLAVYDEILGSSLADWFAWQTAQPADDPSHAPTDRQEASVQTHGQ
ncbi:glycosyltransferase [Gluconacetobacter sacchari DSM 12717]|uniref:Glycosyltransferase family 4 protein n=2 Tax=Gluconacetobacter sacchari TaxID=92759 RepID=A0A7W4IDE0_9PROT|nr:glycosyltransferase family 4 protein [Gluconacetobacter sacchari]MBB2160794.1 glycosyltransferase family 4 protein [Gluconacetobacter sacchari]GBQ28062.1 glycosyltransferase [Gluconacetobacter sacchari DSM 12717]